MGMKALVDGDLILYRTGFAIEKSKYLVEVINPSGYSEFHKYDGKKEADSWLKNALTGVIGVSGVVWARKELEPVEHGYQIINNTLHELQERYGSDIEIFISGHTNFRDRLWTTKKYKGNRDAQQKPTHYEALKTYLMERYGAKITDGIEADDAIGIHSTSSTICVSLDKDLDQIPGYHYDWVNKDEYIISAKQAKTMFYMQLMAGDPTDNVQGIPGIGPAKAMKALANCPSPKDMMEEVVRGYKEAFKDDWYTRLIETAQLVYILRADHPVTWTTTKDHAHLVEIVSRDRDAEAA